MKQEGKPTQGMGKRLVAALSTLAMLVSLSPVALAEETAVLDESAAQVQQVDDPSSESDGPGAEVSDETRTSAEQENPESPATPETSEPATLAVQAEEAVEEVVEEDADLYQASAMLGGKNMADAGLTTISDTRNNVAEGVTYRKIITKNASGQNIGFLTEVDLSKHVKIKAAYNGYYTAGSTAASRATASKSLGWSFETPTKMAADYESTADHEGTVVMATNGDYFNMGTGEPLGYLIMEGNQIKTTGEPYFAILNNGTAVIRAAGSDCSDVKEAISGPFLIAKDGQYTWECSTDTSVMPRNSIGIRADGSVVLFLNDGRQAPKSLGMTLKECASVMLDAGCVDVLYLDGGGSASVSARAEGSSQLKVVNSPSDGAEREVASGLLVVSTAESSGVFDHASIAPYDELYTPGSQIRFEATGADSAGFPAEIPAGVTWALAADSTGMGTIDASGVFTAGDKTGSVTVELKLNGKTVGSSIVEIVTPDQISFSSEEISLGFEDTTDFGLMVRYKDRDIHIKEGDIVWSLTDEKMGSFDGNIFTSSDGESLNGNVTATSAFDPSLSASIHVIVGMLPTIVWDFEDHVNENGTVTPAEEYYNSILTHSNYGRGGKESFEIVSIDDEEPVRFGAKSLKLNYDFTQCGAVTEGACVGTTESMTVPGTPTAIGVWVYAPEGVGITWEGDGTQAGFWLRGYVRDGSGINQPYDFTLEPKAIQEGSDQQPGIYWEGWKYLEADLTHLTGPFSIQPGMTFRLMYVAGTKMGTKTANSVYFDNLQFVYGTNVDDIDSPQVDSIKINGAEELVNGAELTSDTLNLRAEFSDVQNKYTSGVDASTVRMYIDGVNVVGNDHYEFAVNANDGYAELYNLKLADGEHSVTVSLRDNFGNDVEETRRFTVNAGTTAPGAVQVVTAEDIAALGGTVNLEIRSTGETVTKSEISIRLSKMFPDYEVTFAPNYEGTSKFSKMTTTLTVTAQRKENAAAEDDGLIATVTVKVPATLTANESFLYEVKSGAFATVSGFYGTCSAAQVNLPVSAAISVSCDPIIVGGKNGVLRVLDRDGKSVAGAEIYLASDDSLIGTTDEFGKLETERFNAEAAKNTVYAKTQDGKLSFRYDVISYEPTGTFENAQDHVMFNVSTDGDTTGKKRITWISDPLEGGAQYLCYREPGKEGWETRTAAQTMLTFTKGGSYKVANLNTVVLSALEPGKTYEYQVGNSAIWSEAGTGTFTVSDESKFFVMSDIQADDMTNVDNMMSLIGEEGYSFGIQTGDAIDDVTGYDEVAGITNLLGAEKLNGLSMIHVLGNHEYYGDADAERASALFALDEAKSGSYYSVTYGDVYVAVINYTATNAELNEALDWMVKDAQASNATWKVLTMHQPPYYTNANGGNAPINTYVPAAAEKAGIDVVFSGHDHSLARTNPLTGGEIDEKNGILYYIGGSSGEKSYGITSQTVFDYEKTFAIATTDFTATYIGVEADKEKMVLTMYDVTGANEQRVVDTCTLYTEEGACARDGHDFESTPVCDHGKLVCNNCGALVDPAKAEYTGWATDQGTGRRMYFVAGQSQKGEFLLDTDIYYFDENGVAYDGKVTLDEVELEFDNGLLIGGHTGFVKKRDGNTYHYENGAMTHGWYEEDGSWYHFDAETGIMNTQTHVKPDAEAESKNAYYDFGEDGKLLFGYPNTVGYYYWPGYQDGRNTQLPHANAWVKNGYDHDPEAWYRTNDTGHYVTDPKLPKESTVDIAVDGVVYTFDNDNGKLLDGSIVNKNGTLYYYWAGEPVNNGWFERDGSTYYAYPDGHLAKGSVVINGEEKAFAPDGKLITEGTILYASLSEDNGYITVKLVQAPEDLTKVRFAIWATEDRKGTIRWVNAEKDGNGLWKTVEPMCEFGAKSADTFQIHAYATVDGTESIVTTTTVEVPEVVDHLYTDDSDATCNRCDYVREVKPVRIETVPMFRLYNPNTGEHFYTGSEEERDNLSALGWNYEGISWNAPVYEGDPVYRLCNPNTGDHHYTMSWKEVNDLRGEGWQYEGVAWNSAAAIEENIPQFRLYNPNAECGIHHYTSSEEERDNLVALGWIYEGLAWYGTLQ